MEPNKDFKVETSSGIWCKYNRSPLEWLWKSIDTEINHFMVMAINRSHLECLFFSKAFLFLFSGNLVHLAYMEIESSEEAFVKMRSSFVVSCFVCDLSPLLSICLSRN